MAKLYIISGFPFAGKSTIARTLVDKFKLVRVALDDINVELNRDKEELSEDDWQVTYDIYSDRISKNLRAGNSVITDTVAHTKEARDGLRRLAQANNAVAQVIFVATPLETVKQRLQKNRKTLERVDVEDAIFDEITRNFEVPTEDEHAIWVKPDTRLGDIYKHFA